MLSNQTCQIFIPLSLFLNSQAQCKNCSTIKNALNLLRVLVCRSAVQLFCYGLSYSNQDFWAPPRMSRFIELCRFVHYCACAYFDVVISVHSLVKILSMSASTLSCLLYLLAKVFRSLSQSCQELPKKVRVRNK